MITLGPYRLKLATRLGLNPADPWVWKLSPFDVLRYLSAIKFDTLRRVPIRVDIRPAGLRS